MLRKLALCLALAGSLFASPIAAQEKLEPNGRVLDQAGVLSVLAELKLNERLGTIEQRSAVDMVVMTAASLDGQDPDEFSEDLLDRWETLSPGSKHRAIMLLAPNERTFTVHLRTLVDKSEFEGRPDAYWIEKGVLPPSRVDQLKVVISNAVVAKFKESDWSGGLNAGIAAIEETLTDAALSEEVEKAT